MGRLDEWDSARFAVVGDLHANLAVTARVLDAAVADGCDTIVSVGDLGVAWPRDGLRFVNWLHQQLELRGLRMVFVDGNHEGWPHLVALRSDAPGEAVALTSRLVWADRGAQWSWGPVRFGALGGAYSIDAANRTAGRNWWPAHEQPTAADVERLAARGRIDVLISHEAPMEVPLVSRWPEGCDAELSSLPARQLVSEAVGATDARVVYHGHWHHRHTSRVRIAAGAVDVIGLGGDGGPFDSLWIGVDVRTLVGAAA